MKLSSLSLIYVALSAFVAASILIVHMNHSDAKGAEWATPLSLTNALTRHVPVAADPAETVHLWSASVTRPSVIEM